ncbi:hypothetical protein [Gloeobacter kilaueensis]|uniref:Uncharacterized protein n=1 Tax=Gloeobacter kilaueensis (strain ATCC BAA-2537 / CCAP 1431/1 / ULC 316 / JS1) TaxID=1183438 RepID=U5QH23_GLOK1|nr:hypothetical protein [Gloeobacter kilaueensis]AGY58241.1 hypothetical protein GKIL_1995 [Gloeobacter kilaueensis JS1]
MEDEYTEQPFFPSSEPVADASAGENSWSGDLEAEADEPVIDPVAEAEGTPAEEFAADDQSWASGEAEAIAADPPDCRPSASDPFAELFGGDADAVAFTSADFDLDDGDPDADTSEQDAALAELENNLLFHTDADTEDLFALENGEAVDLDDQDGEANLFVLADSFLDPTATDSDLFGLDSSLYDPEPLEFDFDSSSLFDSFWGDDLFGSDDSSFYDPFSFDYDYFGCDYESLFDPLWSDTSWFDSATDWLFDPFMGLFDTFSYDSYEAVEPVDYESDYSYQYASYETDYSDDAVPESIPDDSFLADTLSDLGGPAGELVSDLAGSGNTQTIEAISAAADAAVGDIGDLGLDSAEAVDEFIASLLKSTDGSRGDKNKKKPQADAPV